MVIVLRASLLLCREGATRERGGGDNTRLFVSGGHWRGEQDGERRRRGLVLFLVPLDVYCLVKADGPEEEDGVVYSSAAVEAAEACRHSCSLQWAQLRTRVWGSGWRWRAETPPGALHVGAGMWPARGGCNGGTDVMSMARPISACA